MPPVDKHTPDEDRIIAYLLGQAPPEEAEQLDELSVTDDEFAARLRAAENDLVDGYVRGELSGGRLERFQSVYLSSTRRREKVALARSFLALADRGTPAVMRQRAPIKRFPKWALALAASVVMVAGGILLYRPSQPGPPPGSATQPQAKAPRPEQPPQTPPPVPGPRLETAVAIVLAPQLRGAGAIPTLSLTPGTDSALFHLELESDDSAGYRVALRNPASDQVMWRSGLLHSEARGEPRTVSVKVPARLFKPQTYTLELSGVAASRMELIGSYTFRVAR